MSPHVAADPYPSRVGGEARVLERIDPVVWGDASETASLPLHSAQIEHFERRGYLHLPAFFDAEAVERMQAESARLAALEDDREELVREPDDETIRSVFAFHRMSSLLDRVCRHPRLLAIVRFLLNDEVYLHQTRINYKPAFRGREFYWHSDFETWHVEDGMPRMRAVSASIALTDNGALNGPLMLVPGSHRVYLSCTGRTPPNHHLMSLRKQEIGVPNDAQLADLVERGGIDAPTGPAGSVLLFDCNVMHGSGSNLTPWPRSNLFVVYNACSNALSAPFGTAMPRPEHVAHREMRAPLCPSDGDV